MKSWTTFVPVTDKQGWALDKMAAANGYRDGLDMLSAISGESRSKFSRMPRARVQAAVDRAFERFGR